MVYGRYPFVVRERGGEREEFKALSPSGVRGF